MGESSLFLFVCGAGSCREVPALIRALVALRITVYSVLTPNVAQVVEPVALMQVAGNRWIRDYGEPPLERFPFGWNLVAPCTFNTLNKLALGIADNLATSMVADAIGAGNRVVIAPGMNQGQWSNPTTGTSLARLRGWGCEIVMPREVQGRLTMGSVGAIVDAVASPPGPG